MTQHMETLLEGDRLVVVATSVADRSDGSELDKLDNIHFSAQGMKSMGEGLFEGT